MVKRRTPTLGLMLGFIVALAAVIAYSSFMTVQIGGLFSIPKIPSASAST